MGILTRLFQKKSAKFLEQCNPADIVLQDMMANSFGIESLGMAQIRGNGLLVLLRDRIQFWMYVPERTLNIPINHVTKVETASFHLGKSRFRPLLKISFINVNQQPDSIAWWVQDLPQWITQIQSRIHLK